MIPSGAFAAAWAYRTQVATRPDAPGLFLALAPMDGVTDWVYRELMTDLAGGRSGISHCVCEFVRVVNQRVQPHVLRRHCPELDTGGRTRAGVEVFVQLLGGVVEPMAQSAALAAELGAPGIDINFGCPAKTVNNHDGGAAILKTPRRVEAIVRAVRQAVPATIPVTAKIRLGWDGADSLVDIARAAEAGGAAWLTVHARTRVQLYRPPVHWAELARAREATRFAVVANGDLNTVDDLHRCAQQSGCHAFMIGRGSMGRPWLFRQARGHQEPDFEFTRFTALLRDYVVRLQRAGAPERAALGRLKQWLRLGAPAFGAIGSLFDSIKRKSTLAQALEVLERGSPHLPSEDPHRARTTAYPAAGRVTVSVP